MKTIILDLNDKSADWIKAGRKEDTKEESKTESKEKEVRKSKSTNEITIKGLVKPIRISKE